MPRFTTPGEIIIQATVGSTAYGLAREGSDIDTLGVYVAPTRDFWRLREVKESVVVHEPADAQFHEVGKYCRLALKCNPTLIELLYLDDHSINFMTPVGVELRSIRSNFLSAKYVRSAFGGYARQQAERLQRRNAEGKPNFSSDTAKRTAKHARHCFRLLRQGLELLESGELTVRVRNPEDYWAFDNYTVEEIVARFEEEDAIFQQASSCLPEEPNHAAVENFLMKTRERYLTCP